MLKWFLSSKESTDISILSFVRLFAVLVAGYLLYQVFSIVIMLFLAFIITVALNPLVTGIQRRLKLSRATSTGIVYFLVVTLTLIVLGVILPPLVGEMYQLSMEVFHLAQNLEVPFFLRDILSEFNVPSSVAGAVVGQVGNSVASVFSGITSTFFGVFSFTTTIVMSFYLMLDRPQLARKVMWFTRDMAYIEKTEGFVRSLEHQLGGWVRGQSILMLVMGLLTYVGLVLLGVPYALPLAVLAGMLEILPNLGPSIAAIPAILLAGAYSGWFMGGVVTLFYIVIQQIENNIIVPKILKDNVDVNPLVAITAILIGLHLGGVIGALLAIPTYIVVRTVYGYSRD
jgi:predicted PurR-regulated permease PerM